MKKKPLSPRFKEIVKAMNSFPKEVQRQVRAHRQEIKLKKAFGKLSLKPKPSKR